MLTMIDLIYGFNTMRLAKCYDNIMMIPRRMFYWFRCIRCEGFIPIVLLLSATSPGKLNYEFYANNRPTKLEFYLLFTIVGQISFLVCLIFVWTTVQRVSATTSQIQNIPHDYLLQGMQKASHIARQNSQDYLPPNFVPTVNMKKRTLSGSCGVGVFVLAFGFIVIAFATPNWLVSDYRITGAKLERLGLWQHCFRSLPDVNDDSQRRFFVGCRWVYDPFTTGYDEIRGFLLPGFMIATQFFFTLAFMAMLVSAVGVMVFFLCAGPDQKHFIKLIHGIGYMVLGAGVCASIAVIVFALLGNRNNWMPEHANNWFGWSFILACAGAVMALVACPLFLSEATVQRRKRTLFKESQTRFEMMHGK